MKSPREHALVMLRAVREQVADMEHDDVSDRMQRALELCGGHLRKAVEALDLVCKQDAQERRGAGSRQRRR